MSIVQPVCGRARSAACGPQNGRCQASALVEISFVRFKLGRTPPRIRPTPGKLGPELLEPSAKSLFGPVYFEKANRGDAKIPETRRSNLFALCVRTVPYGSELDSHRCLGLPPEHYRAACRVSNPPCAWKVGYPRLVGLLAAWSHVRSSSAHDTPTSSFVGGVLAGSSRDESGLSAHRSPHRLLSAVANAQLLLAAAR